MAKKNKERIILENVELKPQVIGYTYQKKSNIGRVIFIFIIFALAVFYINDISTFINDLLGKNTAPSIKENTESNKPNNSNKNELPDTGLDTPSIAIVAICVISAIYAYKKVRDYNNI